MKFNFEHSPSFAKQLDAADALSAFRNCFHIPQHHGADSIYFCGNSLGLQPRKAADYVNQELSDWARLGVEGHFHAKNPWMPYHEFLTDNIAHIVCAKPSDVVVMNSLTSIIHFFIQT
jgi:kynureninase